MRPGGRIEAAVSELDQVTQQDSAVSEESAAASEELLSQARLMEESAAELEELVKGTRSGQAHANLHHDARTKSATHPQMRAAHITKGAAKEPVRSTPLAGFRVPCC